jgi:YebC/PmpR family DNA-binding regulatory protein
MSGHSKWAKLKHSKGAIDAKRSALFTKLGQAIVVASREKGGDLDTNFKLRLAVERAKKANLPKENIERAIKKGTGEIKGQQIEEITYEAFGPEGSAFVIDVVTDNRNRSVTNMRKIFSKHGGNLGGQNSVLWMFDQLGVIRLSKELVSSQKEEWQLKFIEFGAIDFKEDEEEFIVYSDSKSLQKLKEKIEEQGLEIESAEIEWVPKDSIAMKDGQEKKIFAIFEELEDDPDVQNYYTNFN